MQAFSELSAGQTGGFALAELGFALKGDGERADATGVLGGREVGHVDGVGRREGGEGEDDAPLCGGGHVIFHQHTGGGILNRNDDEIRGVGAGHGWVPLERNALQVTVGRQVLGHPNGGVIEGGHLNFLVVG